MSLIEAMEHVSKLRSRRAVLLMCAEHIKSLYRETDAGPPESHITRDDYALVPAPHIEDALVYFDEVVRGIDSELSALTNQTVITRDSAEPEEDDEDEEVPESLEDVIRIVGKKEAKNGVKATGRDQGPPAKARPKQAGA